MLYRLEQDQRPAVLAHGIAFRPDGSLPKKPVAGRFGIRPFQYPNEQSQWRQTDDPGPHRGMARRVERWRARPFAPWNRHVEILRGTAPESETLLDRPGLAPDTPLGWAGSFVGLTGLLGPCATIACMAKLDPKRPGRPARPDVNNCRESRVCRRQTLDRLGFARCDKGLRMPGSRQDRAIALGYRRRRAYVCGRTRQGDMSVGDTARGQGGQMR